MRPAPRLLLALCGVAALLAACESAPVSGRSQMMLVSESEERQMGLQAYQQVLSKESLSYDAETNALVEKVGRRIAAAAQRPVARAALSLGIQDRRQERAQRILPARRKGRGL
jgi:predicted Zn-dependent protease